MKKGDKYYSKKYGIVTLVSKRYKTLGNRTVWVAETKEGKKIELDGSEVSLSDHFESSSKKDIAEKLIDSIEKVKGDKGDVPVKGVDYFTEKEKQEIIDEVYKRIIIPEPEDGYTPIAGVDYPSETQLRAQIEELVDQIPRPKEIDYPKVISSVLSRIKLPEPKNGKDGSPDTPKEIRNKLETLKGDARLDAKAIKNIPRGFGIGGGSFTGQVRVDETDSPNDLERKLIAGANITITKSTSGSEKILTIAGQSAYNDESAQDAVGGILADSSTIDFTYNDATPSITASVIDEGIQDIVGAMVSGNTETGVSVTYDDAGGKLNFDAQTAGDLRYQPLDSDLTTISGLTATTNNFLQSKSSAWASRTPTQVTADLDAMVGDSGAGGTKGLVPAPASGDAAASKFLKADGSWSAPAGAGDFVGPGSSTDNAVVRFDGTTGKLGQNSAVTIADTSGDVTGGKYNKITVTAPATGATLTIDDGFTLHATGNVTSLSGAHTGSSSGTNTGDQTLSGLGGATTALDNLASVAINATLIPGTSDAVALGSTTKQWSDLFLAEGGVINWDNGDATLTQAGNMVTLAGADLTVPQLTDSGLTSGRVTYAGASGILKDSANFTFDGNVLSLTGSSPATGLGIFQITPTDVTQYNTGINFDASNGANAFFQLRAKTAEGAIPAIRFYDSSNSNNQSTIGLERSSPLLGGTTNDLLIYNSVASRDIRFGTVGTTRMILTSTGRLGINIASASIAAMLHLPAGTTAASTAPLKFTSGSLMTTAEAGAVEFLTDAYYGTITTGSARKQFAFTDSAITSSMFIGTTSVALNRSSAALTLAGITLTTPDIGTPSAGVLTNATGLPIAGLVASTVTAIGVGSVELGHASDTSITRVSAGVVAVEGVNVVLKNLLMYSNLNTPEGTLINGKIAVSVANSDLTVALKGWDGNDPSATNPVYCMIGGVIRTVTAALSVTKNDGTNWCNAGGAELATKEIDYFAYLGYNATDGVVIGFSRVNHARQYSDFSATTTNEKYCAISTITTAASTDYYNVIGRFAATLSAGAGYTWTVPTFTAINLIQRPIYETRLLTFLPIWTGYSSSPTGTNKYKLRGSRMILEMSNTDNLGTSNANTNKFTTPFAPAETQARMMGLGFGWNNGAGLAGFRIEWTAGTALMTTYIDKDANVWTTSGTKAINIGGMEWEI